MMKCQEFGQIGVSAMLLAALTACGGSSETTVDAGASPDESRVADLSLREVDWAFCQEGYPDNCHEGTAIVWLSPDRVSGDVIEPEAILARELTGFTIALESHGCFPPYEEPQELAYYDLTVPVQLEGDASSELALADQSEIDAQMSVEVLAVRPLSDATVQSLTVTPEEAVLPPLTLGSGGDCQAENVD